jgi:hypothetical protein
MSKQYLSCAETAKLVRSALKESFPGVKFSVKSSVYSGGASINVSYVDGPSAAQVKKIVGMFEGSYFDGMTDYKGNKYSSLDGQEVMFGADFIFVNRKLTTAYLEVFVMIAAAKYGYPKFEVYDNGFGAWLNGTNYDQERVVMQLAHNHSVFDTIESVTLARVNFLGDDGYGYGAVGRIAA